MFNTTYIGLDVHARTVRAATLNVSTDEMSEATLAVDDTSVAAWVAGFGDAVRVTYEAGPSGYKLARRLLATTLLSCLHSGEMDLWDSYWERSSG